jgi:hypothetical protein
LDPSHTAIPYDTPHSSRYQSWTVEQDLRASDRTERKVLGSRDFGRTDAPDALEMKTHTFLHYVYDTSLKQSKKLGNRDLIMVPGDIQGEYFTAVHLKRARAEIRFPRATGLDQNQQKVQVHQKGAGCRGLLSLRLNVAHVSRLLFHPHLRPSCSFIYTLDMDPADPAVPGADLGTAMARRRRSTNSALFTIVPPPAKTSNSPRSARPRPSPRRRRALGAR